MSLKKNPAFRLGCIAAAALLVVLSLIIAPPEGLAPEGVDDACHRHRCHDFIYQ